MKIPKGSHRPTRLAGERVRSATTARPYATDRPVRRHASCSRRPGACQAGRRPPTRHDDRRSRTTGSANPQLRTVVKRFVCRNLRPARFESRQRSLDPDGTRALPRRARRVAEYPPTNEAQPSRTGPTHRKLFRRKHVPVLDLHWGVFSQVRYCRGCFVCPAHVAHAARSNASSAATTAGGTAKRLHGPEGLGG
jgi:hypothetical protein